MLVNDCEPTTLYKLLGKVLGALVGKDEPLNEADGDRDVVVCEVFDGVKRQVDDVKLAHIDRDSLTLLLVEELHEWDVEDPKDVRSDHACSRCTTSTGAGPFLDG